MPYPQQPAFIFGGGSEPFPRTDTKQIPRMTGFQKVQVRGTQVLLEFLTTAAKQALLAYKSTLFYQNHQRLKAEGK